MFPSFADLQFLQSMGALTQDQVNMYYNGGAINADQVKQLGFTVPQTAQATPKSAAPAQPNNQNVKPNPVANK